MEPTHLKRGSEPGLPVPVGSVQPEVYERAPTLMAGEMAGTQGKVRVWYPSRNELYASMAGGGFYILMGLMRMCIRDHSIGYFYILFGVLLTAPGLRGLWHPRYISTDNAGIAISARRGNKALRWSEITSFTHNRRHVVLVLLSGKVKIDVMGYPDAARNEFVALLESRVTPQKRLPSLPALSSPQLRACRGMKEPEPDPVAQPVIPAPQRVIPAPVAPPAPLRLPSGLSSPQMRACRGMKAPD